jgi:NAD(P)-dependent dehydrogenase (short-subunit alcohol dehydrogenase family)
MSDKKRVILVTGTSSGIGEATAIRLARGGNIVYATARNVGRIAKLEAEGCRVTPLDVTEEASMKAAVTAIEAEHGAVDVLVNNAGYSQSGAVETVTMAQVRAQFETNVFGLIRLTQLVLPGMRRKGAGRVVNVSSMGGKLVFPGSGIYHASKHAVEALSDALRFEVNGFGIDVVVIEPGLTRTGFADAAVASIEGGDGLYGPFNAAVATATRNAAETGMLSRFAGTADDVAQVIERAILARRPKTRYTVTASAKLLLLQRRILSDRLWHRVMRRSFPTPGAA